VLVADKSVSTAVASPYLDVIVLRIDLLRTVLDWDLNDTNTTEQSGNNEEKGR